MPVVNSPMGRFRFPDDMPMEDIDAEMSALHAPEPPQGNNFAGALRSAFFPEQQQAPSVLPVISAPGLSPQNGDRLRGIVGQQQQLDAREMLRQRATREKAIEAEKERAKDLALERQRYKNKQAEMQMKLDQDIALIQREEENGTIQIGSDGVARRVYKKKDPETGESKYTVETYGEPIAKATRPPADYTIGNTRFSGSTNKPLVTAQQDMTPQQKMQQDIEVRRLLNSAKLSPEEDLQAWEMYKATGEIPTFTPNNSRAREFTWRDIMAEKARRRQADQFGVKTEADIDAEVASDFGMSVDEMRNAMKQRSNGSVGPSSGSLPDYLRRPATPQPPAPPQAGQGFDDEASIPEGAQVQDEHGRILVKKNGKLVPVTAFGQ